jgi:4-hydroxybenzoate polyprenyltransferase
MTKLFVSLLKTARPRQWIKNFALLAGLIFTGNLENQDATFLAIKAFFIFCGISSATYFINDCFDQSRDREHPFKRLRPIASGALSIPFAISFATLLTGISLYFANQINPAFFLATLAYLILQLLYSSILKTIILIDVMTIAAGFVLRIYAGVWAIGAHLNVWFLLTITSFALFLAIGKRRSELTLMQHHQSSHKDAKTRETLKHYPEALLDILTAMFANSTWISYAFFSFLQPPILARPRVLTILNVIFAQRGSEAKYLMATIPIVIYGVMRYLYVIYEKKEGESPERVLLTDKPLLFAVILWALMVVGIIYFLGA